MCSGLHITLRQTSPTFLDVFIASQAKYNNASPKLQQSLVVQQLLQRLSQNELVTSGRVSLVRLIFNVIMAKSCQMFTCVFLSSKDVPCQDVFHRKPLRCATWPHFTLCFLGNKCFMWYFTSTVSSHLDTTQEYGHSVPSNQIYSRSCQCSLPTSKASSNHPCPARISVPLYKFTEEVTQGASEIGKIFNIFLSIKHCQHQFLSPKYQRKRIQMN